MDNIQRSEKVIAIVLGVLIEKGILDWTMDSETIEMDNDLRPYFPACFKWLVNEGIVSTAKVLETSSGLAAVNPSLTSRGFVLLGQKLELSDNTIKLATAVEEVRSTSRSYSQAGDFFGGILGGFSKSLGS